MKVLLWKEYREKRIWIIALIASAVALTTSGSGYLFFGSGLDLHGLSWVSVIIALIFGASAYSSELAGGNTDFAYSRPVSWKKMLFAKVLTGLAAVAITVLAALIAFRLFAPEPYTHLVFTAQTALIAGRTALILFAAYLTGVACSVALPGIMGGVLTYILIMVLLMLEAFIYEETGLPGFSEWIVYTHFLAILAALVIIARFGLTLSISARLSRYLLLLAVGAVLTLSLVLSGVKPPFSEWTIYERWIVSPSGNYAVVVKSQYNEYDVKSYLVRISDGHREFIGDILPYQAVDVVTDDGTFFTLPYNVSYQDIVLVWMDEAGKVHKSDIKERIKHDYQVTALSPNKRLLLLGTGDEDEHALKIIDLKNRRMLDTKIENVALREFWWQSDTEVGYKTRDGQRRVVQVVGDDQ